jgi:hypothetical protein
MWQKSWKINTILFLKQMGGKYVLPTVLPLQETRGDQQIKDG